MTIEQDIIAARRKQEREPAEREDAQAEARRRATTKLQRERLGAPSTTRNYLELALSTYQGLVEQGYLSQDVADRYMDDIAAYIDAQGITPKLPYYEDWQAISTGEKLPTEKERQYENIKSAYLASTDMSFNEKYIALLRLHPNAGNVEISRQIKNEVFASLSPEEQTKIRTENEQRRYDTQQRQLAEQRTTLRPEGFEFEPAFEEERLGLGGSQIWKNWYEDRFGLQIRRFKGQVEDQTEETWATFLKRQTPKLREEFQKVGAFRRGERPSAFQPRIRTVNF